MNANGSSSNGADHITMVMGSSSGMSIKSDDDDDQCPSSPTFVYKNNTDLMAAAMGDEVTAQLAAAGPVGVAAAAAIVSSKNQKRPHSFETNPSKRKRQQNRLVKKLRETIDEFATKVGQQAIVLVATPDQKNTSYKVFGAKPLEGVIKNLKVTIMDELENALAHQAPPPEQEDPTLFELPPLTIDGIPTPVDKLTQAQLRSFIPLMLKYSTGRGKPRWGRESARPPWWPKELPWANVRMDARSDDEKQKISWTNALRKVVIDCYKFHGREDLLPAFTEEDEKPIAAATSNANITTQYTPMVLHTITNPDGNVTIVQFDVDNPIITLPDGTTSHVEGMATLQSGNGDGTPLHTIQTISEGGSQGEVVDLNSVTVISDGQIVLTTENRQANEIGYLKDIPVNRELLNLPLETRLEPCKNNEPKSSLCFFGNNGNSIEKENHQKDYSDGDGYCSIDLNKIKWSSGNTKLLIHTRLSNEKDFSRLKCKKIKLWQNIAKKINEELKGSYC